MSLYDNWLNFSFLIDKILHAFTWIQNCSLLPALNSSELQSGIQWYRTCVVHYEWSPLCVYFVHQIDEYRTWDFLS